MIREDMNMHDKTLSQKEHFAPSLPDWLPRGDDASAVIVPTYPLLLASNIHLRQMMPAQRDMLSPGYGWCLMPEAFNMVQTAPGRLPKLRLLGALRLKLGAHGSSL
jgi:hypothetical protein